MDKLNIIYVDDQREVLSTLSKDLEVFEKYFNLEECESAKEAMEVLDDVYANGDLVAILISDHIMPGENGVEFLSNVHKDGRFTNTKKVLLTGQATHKDTIDAINYAKIERYVEKPWKSDEIVEIVKILITQYIVTLGIDYQKYLPVLHQQTLFDMLKNQV